MKKFDCGFETRFAQVSRAAVAFVIVVHGATAAAVAQGGTAAAQAGQTNSSKPAIADPAAANSTQGQPADQGPAIVVTGFRASLSSALAAKKRETAAIDSIVAEDIGKFPDSNLAESMQRIPGVALQRGDGGEGRNISVRGLGAQFTRVRINGMEGASQTGSLPTYL